MTALARLEALDPITVEVVRNKLDGIANEMQLDAAASSFSPIVKEGLDASASLFTAARHTLAQALRDPDPSRHAHPGGRAHRASSSIRSTACATATSTCLNDPYTRRHASARHRRHHAGVRIAARPIAFSGRHDPSPGRRRHVAGLGADQRHRDLPGGHPHPAAEAARRRRLQRHAGQDDPAQNVRIPDTFDGRPDAAGRGLHGRRRAGWPSSPTATATTSWPRSSTSCSTARRR